MSKALIIHGGAPTAVINASLYGVLEEAKEHNQINTLIAAKGGIGGVINRDYIDLFNASEHDISLLPFSPASAIGTSRKILESEDYYNIAQILLDEEIDYVFFNGGNGSMDTCGKLSQVCKNIGAEVQFIGIPKTMDNDLSITDHSPGFGSAARYVAGTVSEVACDIQSLPIHVCILEVMGRNAGWLTASSALARESGFGPDLIYSPEIPFDEKRFLDDVDNLHRTKNGILVVVGESLRDINGDTIVKPIFKEGRSEYFGDVSSHLAQLVVKNLKTKARCEKPGLCGRASIRFQSDTDRDEAILVGRKAVQAAIDGQTDVMVGLERFDEKKAYSVKTTLIPIDQVMLNERKMPKKYINEASNDVTNEFCDWCRPLLGKPLPEFAKLY